MIETDGDDEEVCAICWEALGDENAYALPCAHRFHPWCVLRMVSTGARAKCPLCRAGFHPPRRGGEIGIQWLVDQANRMAGWAEYVICLWAASTVIFLLGGSAWNPFSYIYFFAVLGWIVPSRRNENRITVTRVL
jgi:hypothetical protein